MYVDGITSVFTLRNMRTVTGLKNGQGWGGGRESKDKGKQRDNCGNVGDITGGKNEAS